MPTDAMLHRLADPGRESQMLTQQQDVRPLALGSGVFPSGVPLRTAAVEEALARLAHVVECRRTLGVLYSAAGLGKSTLLGVLADELTEPLRRVVLLNAAGMDAQTLIGALSARLGLGNGGRCLPDRVARMTDYLLGLATSQESTALLIDDFDLAEDAARVLILRLVRRFSAQTRGISWILAVNETDLHTPVDIEGQSPDLAVRLRPWNSADLVRYVLTLLERHAQRTASPQPILNDAALKALLQCSRGYPGQVAKLLEFALMACEVDLGTAISEELVFAAANDLFPWRSPSPQAHSLAELYHA